MRVAAPALSQHLANEVANELAGAYLVFGQEQLLVEEAADALRKAAQEKGFLERIPLNFEQGFDWQTLLDQFQAILCFLNSALSNYVFPMAGRATKAIKQ